MATNNKKNKVSKRNEDVATAVKILAAIAMLLILICFVKTCSYCRQYQQNVVVLNDQTGYLPENEDWDRIPEVVPPYNDEDTTNLPSQVSLEPFFPPIGDQGKKGTCVAWAVGYNLKTALNALENHWTANQLQIPQNQTSPKDLWYGIDDNVKGPNCSGSVFEAAFVALQTRGAASMAMSDATNFQNCNGTFIGDSSNRIETFGRLASVSVGSVKAYLNDSVPLVCGARVGMRFLSCNSSDVIKNDVSGYSGPHAFHAMALVGYNDSLHAFRVRNSWGTAWGDQGSAWVDYDFFKNDFCFVVFVAKNMQKPTVA